MTKTLPEPEYKVSFWGVRCYMYGEYLWGINKFHDFLIPWATFFHNFFATLTSFFIPGWRNPGFKFKILEKYDLEQEETWQT